jgi:hypothetical protein
MKGSAPTHRFAVAAVVAAALLLTSLLVALVTLLAVDASYDRKHELASGDSFMTLAWATVGVILVVKRPGNRVGWAIALCGVGQLVGGVVSTYAELALLAKPEAHLPAGAAAGRIGDGAWTPLMAGVFALFVLFPEGRFPSPRWRWVTRIVLAGFAFIWLVITTAPGHLDPPLRAYTNPLAVTSSKAYIIAAYPFIAVCLVGTAAAGINLVLRFRRSRGRERQQFKWLAASAALFVASLPLAAFADFAGAGGTVFGVALLAIPLSVGVAVLRYRLYEIDVIVRRTLVYAVLTGGLAAVYFGVVLVLQQVFSSFAGGSDLAIAASTLAVAALFRPARAGVQAFVDRRFYRRKYDAERTLAAFAGRLRDEIDLDALTAELTAVVAETMQPAHVSLWLKEAR